MDFFCFLGRDHRNRISDKSKRDPVGDRIRQDHRNHSHECRNRENDIVPFNTAKLLRHQDTNNDQSRRCHRVCDGAQDHWRDEDRQSEEDTCRYSRQTITSANFNTRSLFNESRNCRSTNSRTKYGRDRIGKKRLFSPFQFTLLVDKTNLVTDRNERTSCIEEIDEQEREDDHDRVHRIREQFRESIHESASRIHFLL